MIEYGIGGQEVKPDNAQEAIADIPLNRTLLVQKLTSSPPVKPQMVYDLKTVEEVFENFKPQQAVSFEDADGKPVQETLSFTHLGDFGKKGIINQSKLLQDLQLQVNDFQQFIKHLKSNKILKTVLQNPEAKSDYLASIRAMIDELEEAK
jgi:hypothetical protein